jgi:hypothetical protein
VGPPVTAAERAQTCLCVWMLSESLHCNTLQLLLLLADLYYDGDRPVFQSQHHNTGTQVVGAEVGGRKLLG